ncbi:MAG: peptidoglycan recognition family protein [Planctomycetota bacterium]
MPDKRTIRVLGALVVGMTIVSSILLALEPDPTHRGSMISLSAVDFQQEDVAEKLWKTREVYPWQYIVIHDSFGIAGSERDLNEAWDAEYARQGLDRKGHGYHFVVNDGLSPLGDGEIQITPRWQDQRVGGFIDAEGADNWNRIAVGICVMGDAGSAPFSTAQGDSLTELVKELQGKLDIPRENVIIQVGSATSQGPATYFNYAQFRRSILD